MPISPVLGRQGARVAQQPDGALEAGELGALGSGAAERSSNDARGARVEHGAQLRLRGRREAQHLEAVGVRVVAAEQQRGLLDEESAQEQRGRLMLRQQPRAPFLQVQGQSGQQAELVVPMRCAVLPLDDACDIYARTEQNVP